MTIQKVGHNPSLVSEFIQLPIRLYRNVPQWIRPLDSDIEDVFDPDRNKMFRSGDCCRWVVNDESGQCVGRVAAFYDKRLFKPGKPKIGAFGFFECINNIDVAHMLLHQCEKWLLEQGLDGMDGSINFGDRDKNWGILVEGFDREPNYGMPYTLPYYPALMEAYGCRVFYYQLTYFRSVTDPVHPKLQEKYDRVVQDPNYRFEYWSESRSEILMEAFTQIYNEAWSKHSGVPAMTLAHVKKLFSKLKAVMDKRLIWFGFYGERPVCFFVMLPELNQFFKHVNGKLDWWGKLKFAFYRYVVGTKKMFGVIFGVVPDFQGKGLEGALIMACRPVVLQTPYRQLEMNWIGDFNPKMMHLMETLGATIVKKHATYRLYFDRNFPFEREKAI